MYEFAVVTLLGLATLKVVDLLTEFVPGISRVRTLTTFVVGLLAVIGLDHSMFSAYGIAVRESWVGILLTGFVAGSLASVWHAVLAYLGSDEAVTVEGQRAGRPRIAA